jgi:hypothetical protein
MSDYVWQHDLKGESDRLRLMPGCSTRRDADRSVRKMGHAGSVWPSKWRIVQRSVTQETVVTSGSLWKF